MADQGLGGSGALMIWRVQFFALWQVIAATVAVNAIVWLVAVVAAGVYLHCRRGRIDP